MKQIFVFLVIAVSILSAQDVEVYFNQTAEDYFLLGMRQYTQKEFKPALMSFQRSISSYPGNHRMSASMMMAAKTEYALKNYEATLAICDSILSQFPTTLYREDVYFTRGMCYYSRKDFDRTFEEMKNTYVIAAQRLNKEHSYKVIEHIAAEFYTEEQIGFAITDSLDPEIMNLLIVVLAEKNIAGGKTDEAKRNIARFNGERADQSLHYRINRAISRIEKGNRVRIGVLLPLQQSVAVETREKKIVTELLDGIKLALSDYEDRTIPGQITIEMDVQDSGKDSLKIQSIISGWSEDSSIVGIIGPVFSGETIAAAKIAQQKSIPIITPTASDEGISSIGRYVFQANSTNGAKGKTLAQYAVNVLGARTIAVLGSAMQSSATQADSFTAEAKRLGATIVSDRRYQRTESDLRPYVRGIRIIASNLRPDYVTPLRGKPNLGEITRKLISVGVKLSMIDSIVTTGGIFNFAAVFGDSGKRVADSLNIPVKKTLVYLDSLNYPVSTIDLIYCPISNSHEIGILTSQLAFYNIKAVLLGSGDWNDANELDLNKRYADGVIFGSDRWIDRNDRTNRIYAKYSLRYGKQISENVMYGYDAMSMLINQFSEGMLTRSQLSEMLAGVFEFPGIRNTISLKNERVNSALNILRFKNGAVTKLQTFSYR